jgi:hypothetical protein
MILVLSLKRSFAKYAALALAVAGWYAIGGYELGSFVFWAQLEGNLAALVLVVAAVSVTTAALEWQLVWSHAGQYVPGAAVRSLSPLWLGWLGMAGWMVMGWSIGVLVGTVTYGGTLLGRPNLPVHVTVAATILPLSALGLLCGRLLPRIIGPLLSGAAVYVLMGFVLYGGTQLRLLAPLADGVPTLGRAVSVRFSVLQWIWIVMLTISLMGALISVVTRGSWLPLMAGIIVTTILVAGALVNTEPVVDTPVPTVCRFNSPQVCGPLPMEPTFRSVHRIGRLFSELAGLRISRIELDIGSYSRDEDTGELTLSVGHVQNNPAIATAIGLVGPDVSSGCRNGAANYAIVEALTYMAEPGNPAVSTVGRRVADGLTRDPGWVSTNLERLRLCDVAFEELPGL